MSNKRGRNWNESDSQRIRELMAENSSKEDIVSEFLENFKESTIVNYNKLLKEKEYPSANQKEQEASK